MSNESFFSGGVVNQLNAHQIMQQHGKTFALAAKLLSPASRHDATELYAFARTVDDCIDLQATNHAAQAKIVALQQAFALHAENSNLQDDMQNNMHKLLKKHSISPKVMQAFLQAQLDDEDYQHIETAQALINYSYGVAGSIGRLMRPILGAPVEAEMHAVSLGIAMQLTNIARDVVEDAMRMRVYVPATFFNTHIYAQNIKHPSKKEALIIFAAIEQLLRLADDYYAYARLGYAYIPLRNRLSIAAAGAMYSAIGYKIRARGVHKYWLGRVSISLPRKVLIGAFAICQTLYQNLCQIFLSTNAQLHNEAALAHSIKRSIEFYELNQHTNKTSMRAKK
jgi:15-cis-phytoene synthase